MTLEQIVIVQHNVLKWSTRKFELTNAYKNINPDIILLNSTGEKDSDRIKIFNYNVYQRNLSGQINSGIAIAVKRSLEYTINDDFLTDVLSITIQTIKGPITIATTYLPFRRNSFPLQDINKIIQKPTPSYVIADFNARHSCFGHRDKNMMGLTLDMLLNTNKLKHLGPDFPTLVNKKGTPDIIVGNRVAHLNYSLKEGDITSSDHLPLIVTLATKPILIKIPPKPSYKKANWDLFKAQINERYETDNEDNNRNQRIQGIPEIKNKKYIDQRIENWMENIQKGKEKAIPMSTSKILPHAETSDYLKLLTQSYNNLKNRLNRQGGNREDMAIVTNIQHEIINESLRLQDASWNKLITNMEIEYNNQEKFWRDIKRLQGGKELPAPYLEDPQKNKVRDTKKKEELMRQTWQTVFQISPEENRNFDMTNERAVLDQLSVDPSRTIPYEEADLTRLDPTNPLTAPVSVNDVDRIIKSFKKKAPGISGINKTLLEHLPLSAKVDLTEVTNLTLSMGYFPGLFKEGLMIFIQKNRKKW